MTDAKEDPGEYTYLLVTDALQMLNALSDPSKSPLVRSFFKAKEEPPYFFDIGGSEVDRPAPDKQPLISYAPPALIAEPKDLEKVLKELNINPDEISAELNFSAFDIVISQIELESLEKIANFFKSQEIPFLMIDEGDPEVDYKKCEEFSLIVGGYQPDGRKFYRGSGSNERLHALFE